MRPQDSPNVDAARLRKFFGAGVYVQQLARVNFGRLIWKIVQREMRVAFQNGQPVITVRSRFKDHGRTGDSDRDRFGRNFGAAGILSRVKQDRAAIESHAAAGFVDAKDRVLAQTRDRQVGKCQLGARISSGTECGAFIDFVVNRGRSRVGLRRQNLNVVKNGCDPAFGRWRLRYGEANQRARREEHCQDST